MPCVLYLTSQFSQVVEDEQCLEVKKILGIILISIILNESSDGMDL